MSSAYQRTSTSRAETWGSSRSETARFAVFLAFLAVCALGGGSPRPEVQSLLLVRPAAVLAIVALLLIPGRIDWRTFRVPLLLLGAFALTMAIQLVPLPPALWTALPGHAPFAEAALAAGLPQPWRPISLTPDYTLNSFVSLVVPLAVLVGMAAITREQRRLMLPILIGVVLVSAALGIAQLAAGSGSALRFYRTTNPTSAVGFFANRNHQAVVLALGLPMLMAWASLQPADPRNGYARLWLGLATGLLLLPTILVTGSRAGMLLTVPALVAGWWLFGRKVKVELPRRLAPMRRWLRFVPVVVAAILVLATVVLARAESLQRLFSQLPGEESRARTLPLLIDITGTFLPLGAGFGAFDPAFRLFEPDALLKPSYLNHAHNDLVELVMTGGLPALAVLIAFVVWAARRSWPAFRAPSGTGDTYATLAALLIVLLFAASMVDYPLRTPTVSALFAIACCWLCRPAQASKARRDSETAPPPIGTAANSFRVSTGA